MEAVGPRRRERGMGAGRGLTDRPGPAGLERLKTPGSNSVLLLYSFSYHLGRAERGTEVGRISVAMIQQRE